MQSPCVAGHCGTNAASVGGRRANLSFLLLMGCNAKKNLSSLPSVAGSVSLQYVENGLMLSLREASHSWASLLQHSSEVTPFSRAGTGSGCLSSSNRPSREPKFSDYSHDLL